MSAKLKAVPAPTIAAVPPAKIRLHVDRSTLQVGVIMDLEEMAESGQTNIRSLVNFLAAFVVDDDLNPLPPDVAMSQLRHLTLTELQSAFETITSTVTDTAVSPPTASS